MTKPLGPSLPCQDTGRMRAWLGPTFLLGSPLCPHSGRRPLSVTAGGDRLLAPLACILSYSPGGKWLRAGTGLCLCCSPPRYYSCPSAGRCLAAPVQTHGASSHLLSAAPHVAHSSWFHPALPCHLLSDSTSTVSPPSSPQPDHLSLIVCEKQEMTAKHSLILTPFSPPC